MSKISLGQIDLTALQQYLEIVVGFRKKDDKAVDVQYVGEYTHKTIDDTDDDSALETTMVEAYKVALAALDQNGLSFPYKIDVNGEVDDNTKIKVDQAINALKNKDGSLYIPERQTVTNALLLGGIEAGEYLRRVESGTILTDVNQATYNMADDIRNLKDELYQLKNQLVKTGTLKDSVVYNGFIDPFLTNDPKHVISANVIATGSDAQAGSIDVDGVGDLKQDEYIVLEGENGYSIQRVGSTGYNKIMVDSSESIGSFDVKPGSSIKKSLGVSKNGKFIFGYKTDGTAVGDINVDTVKDGTTRIKVYELDHAGHGFGTEFKIPASYKNKIITAVEVALSAWGQPSDLIGVFWKFDGTNYIKTDYKTEPIHYTQVSQDDSGFNNIKVKLQNGAEMTVEPGEKYLLMLEATSGNDKNKWFIGGFMDDDCLDLVHKDCYFQLYKNDVLYNFEGNSDMYFALETKELIPADIQRLNYGLYTCSFDVHQSTATRVRVEMRINKEGMLKVKDNINSNFARGGTSRIPVEPKGDKVVKQNMFDEGDLLVIGSQLGVVANCEPNNSYVTPVEDMYVAPGADIYRVGYEIQAKVSNKEYTAVGQSLTETYKDFEVYPLKLVAVIPGRDSIRPDQSSDRLIFECDLYDMANLESSKLKQFNHVEIQVKWKAPNDVYAPNDDITEGSIFDIVVSVDQAYTKDPIGGNE